VAVAEANKRAEGTQVDGRCNRCQGDELETTRDLGVVKPRRRDGEVGGGADHGDRAGKPAGDLEQGILFVNTAGDLRRNPAMHSEKRKELHDGEISDCDAEHSGDLCPPPRQEKEQKKASSHPSDPAQNQDAASLDDRSSRHAWLSHPCSRAPRSPQPKLVDLARGRMTAGWSQRDARTDLSDAPVDE